ncbi:Stress response kinase A [invertebrate metagenome]|uniref:Stress response kinase A n=1 Tax=invertebrate metagenome TaxID=1711999 RepID=A0A2H9TA26_9ZZZZ
MPDDLSHSTAHPYKRLTPDSVMDALESQGFSCDARILALNSYENRVYQVGIEDSDPVIVKFYRPDRWDKKQIEEEHRFIAALKDAELPVVAPLCNREESTLSSYDGFLFTVFPRQGGHAPELDYGNNLLIMGRLLGRMHAIGATEPFQHRPGITLDRFGQQSVHFLLEHHIIPDNLITAYETLTQHILEKLFVIEQQGLPEVIRVHGDCHSGNILWRNDNPHFVDFDDAAMAPAVQDIWMLLSGNRQQQNLQLSEIIEGYNEFYSFNPKELNYVEYFRTLRLIHYNAWLARRWSDPAFPKAFSWFNTERYWSEHILELREQLAALDEMPLQLY